MEESDSNARRDDRLQYLQLMASQTADGDANVCHVASRVAALPCASASTVSRWPPEVIAGPAYALRPIWLFMVAHKRRVLAGLRPITTCTAVPRFAFRDASLDHRTRIDRDSRQRDGNHWDIYQGHNRK